MQEKPKPLSGAQRRKLRVERGGPKWTPGELEARRRNARNQVRDRAQMNAWTARRSRENLEFVTALKLEMGCVDCGYREHSQALEFDHLPGTVKVRNISHMMNWPRERLLAEIAKCECVCANCHRVRTTARRTAPVVKVATVPSADAARQLTLL